MPAIDTALLAIYRAARELGCDEFQDTAFAILRGYIPFDSARWARASASPVGVLFHTAHLVNELPAWGDAYSQIRSLDRAATFAIAHPGTTGNFHCESCYPLREDAEMREYFRRYRHEVALVTAHVDRTTGFLCGASGFFGHRFGVKRVIQTGVVDVEESWYECDCARGAGRSA
jgi:hypothetical protein